MRAAARRTAPREDHTIADEDGHPNDPITVYPSGRGVGERLFAGRPISQGEFSRARGSGAAATKLDIEKRTDAPGHVAPSILRPDRDHGLVMPTRSDRRSPGSCSAVVRRRPDDAADRGPAGERFVASRA